MSLQWRIPRPESIGAALLMPSSTCARASIPNRRKDRAAPPSSRQTDRRTDTRWPYFPLPENQSKLMTLPCWQRASEQAVPFLYRKPVYAVPENVCLPTLGDLHQFRFCSGASHTIPDLTNYFVRAIFCTCHRWSKVSFMCEYRSRYQIVDRSEFHVQQRNKVSFISFFQRSPPLILVSRVFSTRARAAVSR